MESQYPEAVDHPKYYGGTNAPVECIDVVENMNFCRGNAIKYLWRAGSKENEIQDLYKAKWYIEREIARVGRMIKDSAKDESAPERPLSSHD